MRVITTTFKSNRSHTSQDTLQTAMWLYGDDDDGDEYDDCADDDADVDDDADDADDDDDDGDADNDDV
jgi:hypothetical protein